MRQTLSSVRRWWSLILLFITVFHKDTAELQTISLCLESFVPAAADERVTSFVYEQFVGEKTLNTNTCFRFSSSRESNNHSCPSGFVFFNGESVCCCALKCHLFTSSTCVCVWRGLFGDSKQAEKRAEEERGEPMVVRMSGSCCSHCVWSCLSLSSSKLRIIQLKTRRADR